MARPGGVAALERVEAILDNPALDALAECIPSPDRARGGRPRHYPGFLWLVFEVLVSIFGSARQAEAELAHPLVWGLVRRRVAERLGEDAPLPTNPMRRHHYRYGRDRYLADPAILQDLLACHRACAAHQARQVGLMDPSGAGSWSHPHPDRVLYADGKVLTPLVKAKPGTTRVDPATGELKPLRHEADAGLHFEGTVETAWGTKFVLVAARREDPHGRIILDIAWVPRPGAEAATAMGCFARLAPHLPGAQAIVYDTALRGVHHQRVLHELGWIPINRVSAASVSGTKKKGHRREKTAYLGTKRCKDTELRLYVSGGAPGIGTLDDRGILRFTPLRRIKTHRAETKKGTYRWYNEYALPGGEGSLILRLDQTEEDRRRGFNRTENLRVIPPSDPDFAGLFRRRNDIESINRGVEDSLYLRRAHSLGHARQLVNLLGYALMVNALALRRYGGVAAEAA